MHWIRRHRRGRPPHPDVLTPAEWRVLELIRSGHTNAEIAVRTGLSINTVKTHVSSIHAKTGIPDRQGLVQWSGVPATARHDSQGALALPLAGWLSKGVAVAGGKLAFGGVAAAAFVGALFFAFSFFAEDDAAEPADRLLPDQWGQERDAVNFPGMPCGIDVYAYRRFDGDAETWQCFRDALAQGQRVQAVSLAFDFVSLWGQSNGDGSGFVLTTTPDGQINVVETVFEDWVPGTRTQYECTDLVSAEPGETVELDDCTAPVAVEGPAEIGGGVVLCGIQVLANAAPPEAIDEDARRCLLDAFEAGSPAQLLTTLYTMEGAPIHELVTVVSPGHIEVHRDSRDPLGEHGKFASRCADIGEYDRPYVFAVESGDCTPMRRIEGPARVCGVDLTLGSREFIGAASWDCFESTWEQEEHALLFVTSLDASGNGTSRLYVSGRGSPAEEYTFNHSVIEFAFENFAATPARTYHVLCGPGPDVAECRGRAQHTTEIDPHAEPLARGGALLCGVELLRDPSIHVNTEARQCLRDAFEAGTPAQFLTVRFTEHGDPVSEVITAFEPGVLYVHRDSWDRDGTPGVFVETCTALDRVDSIRLFELSDCREE